MFESATFIIITNEDNWDNGALYIDNALIKVNENIAESYQIKSGTKIIANGAFDRNKVVTDVVIPNTVEHIGEKAFYSCSYLENIYIPNSVKSVGASAFTSILKGSTIYCESQEVADMLTGYYSTTRTSVVVDSTKF